MTFISDAKHAAARVQSISVRAEQLAPQSSLMSSLMSSKASSTADHLSEQPAAFHRRYPELDVRMTAEDRAFWAFMRPQARPSFTPQLLQDLTDMQTLIGELCVEGEAPFDYFILGSRSPGVFNLGGDLPLFLEKIRKGDREGLRRYAYACTRTGYANYCGYDKGIVTIALFQGDALGGGLESALSCDILIAERRAKFGLPEVLFNLFPGMGAYTFLSRRVGMVKAEEIILGGRTYSAEEMLAMGVIDQLVEDGEGERAVKEFIARNRSRRQSLSSVYKVRRRVNAVTLQELYDINDIWVDSAMRLKEQDLRRMSHIAAAQDRFRARQGHQAAAKIA